MALAKQATDLLDHIYVLLNGDDDKSIIIGHIIVNKIIIGSGRCMESMMYVYETS